MLSAQTEDYNRLGKISNKIFLDKYENHYLISYQDISMDAEGDMVSFKLSSKEEITELYQELKRTLNNESEKPSVIKLNNVELRIYFKNRPLQADYVEVIQENLETEAASTLPWITLKKLDQLFDAALK